MTPARARSCRIMKNVRIPMRDGAELATSVYLPLDDGVYPVVLVRTAYNRAGLFDSFYPEHGIALVVQDVRGRYDSEGDWYPFVAEEADGRDTLEWVHAQPWCNGSAGMFGDSYLAGTQFAAGMEAPELLTALNPRFMAGDCWRHAYYIDGAFSLALTWSWLCFECAHRTSEAAMLPLFDVGELLRTLPIEELDEKSGAGIVPFYRSYVRRWRYDDQWDALNIRSRAERFTMPVLLVGGWYDNYAVETVKNFLVLRDAAPSEEIRNSHRMVIGPWPHGISGKTILGELDFGERALAENDVTHRWLETMLKGGDATDVLEAPIRIFTMGRNEWQDLEEWPPPGTRIAEYHLGENGRLTRETPTEENQDEYTYDPVNPVPTTGGNHSVGPYNPGLYEICMPGPMDQRAVEARDDVLVYTTDPLDEDLEVTGEVRVTLFAASTARDTDFVARLTDVYPDGRSICICEGVIRARWRESFHEPKLLEPGAVYEYTINLGVTSTVFFRDHRIRLDVTSSSFPLWDRNLNTGNDPATDTEMVVAGQTVFHGPARPSRVALRVVGG